MKVEIALQVREFIASLAPDPRKKLRQAIQLLAKNKGDITPLVEDLAGFYRLRCGDFRVIYRRVTREGVPVASCEFAERREVVYQLFTTGTAKEHGASGK